MDVPSLPFFDTVNTGMSIEIFLMCSCKLLRFSKKIHKNLSCSKVAHHSCIYVMANMAQIKNQSSCQIDTTSCGPHDVIPSSFIFFFLHFFTSLLSNYYEFSPQSQIAATEVMLMIRYEFSL